MAITCKIVNVTPELASRWLALNTGNRVIKERVVSIYANTMAEGRWKLNGEAIKINCSRLLDGQHRLLAVIKANVAVSMMVIEGLPDTVFDTLDTGSGRSGADVLHIEGVTDANLVAATLHTLWRQENGLQRANKSNSKIDKATNDLILEMQRKHPDIKNYISAAKTVKIIPASWIAPYYYLFSQIDSDLAEDFIKKLATGEGLSKDSPVLTLRNKLIDTKRSARSSRMQRYFATAMLVKTWNALREGRAIVRLGMREDESFPEIV